MLPAAASIPSPRFPLIRGPTTGDPILPAIKALITRVIIEPLLGRRRTMLSKSRFVIVAIATFTGIASPALAANARTAHKGYVGEGALRVFAKVQVNPNDPTLTGGGSIGYNSNLAKNY
jgi:hypothetical protein